DLVHCPSIFQHHFYINKSRINTTIKPTTEVVNNKSPHVLKVSLIDILKYSLNNQNEASFTCVIVLLPAAVAKTISTGFTLKVGIRGPTMPAAVIAETTPCPVAIRINAVINQAIISGDIAVFCIIPAI